MRVCESVRLPEPLGPIAACAAPLLTESDTPLRISRPSTLTRRSLISKSAIASVSLPVASVFKSNSILLRCGAVEGNAQGVHGEGGTLHSGWADLDAELVQQVLGG